MNLNEFLDAFSAYSPKVIDTFENQWRIYTNDNGVKGLTHTILFDGQNKGEANVSLTFVDDQLVEGSIGFRDCQVIYVDPEYHIAYCNECESRYIDTNGTKNVWDFGDYIPNKYVSNDVFMNAMLNYADQCDMQVPRYDNNFAPYETENNEEPCQKYKVQYTVTIDYEVKAVSMDAAQSEAYVDMIDDLCGFFDNDRIKLIKRAVIENLGE